MPYPPPGPYRGPSSTGRSLLSTILSIIWILAIVGVFILMALNVTALLISPTYIVPGIQGISRGQIANHDLEAGNANWTFLDLGGSGATGTYVPSGGNPGGYLQMSFPAGTNVSGAWEQPFRVGGSTPYLARVQLDVQVQAQGSGAQGGRFVIGIEGVAQGLDVAHAAAVVWLNGTTGWTTTLSQDVSAAIPSPGIYYLKVAYLANANPTPVTVGLDNIHLAWVTDAYFYVIAPLPLPGLLYFSQDPTVVGASYFFVLAAILIPVLYYSYRERKLAVQALTAPLESIGLRLRSMSTWIAVAQAWLAVTFFQFVVILLLEATGQPVTSPIVITAQNTWFYLYDLARASVFEELAFRALPIGVPMVLGALLLHIVRANPAPASGDPTATRRHVTGALRYLWGGQLRKDSSREALLAGWVLVAASSAIFGYAHDVGWGWWKVLPAAVAGLAFGYLFVRHGIGAAILAHFLNDYLNSILLEGIGGSAMEAAISLLFLALVVAGSGFFVWYTVYAWQHFGDLLRRFGARKVRQPSPTGAGPRPPASPPGWAYAPPPSWGTASGVQPPYPPAGPPVYLPPTQPPPPPSYIPGPYPPPGALGWRPQPSSAPSLSVANPAQIPRDYAPTYHPPPYGFPPVRFQCPSCGWVEAKYENRRFTCLRCGRTA